MGKATLATASEVALVSILFSLTTASACAAKCPVEALDIHVSTLMDLTGKRVYAEVTYDTSSNKVELQRKNGSEYSGIVGFSTSGLTLIVELTCSYFPEYFTLYVGDLPVKKVFVDKTKLTRLGESRGFGSVYEIYVTLE